MKRGRDNSWRQHRVVPLLPKKAATCCRCGHRFKTEINPELRGEFGALIRGERQVFRLCAECRADDAITRKDDAHEAC